MRGDLVYYLAVALSSNECDNAGTRSGLWGNRCVQVKVSGARESYCFEYCWLLLSLSLVAASSSGATRVQAYR